MQYNSIFTKCINYWVISQKILHRWYLPPVLLAKFRSINDNSYWSACQGVGTLIHVLWECPNLKSFWNRVFTFISDVTGCLTKPNAALALLSIGADIFLDEFKLMVIHILFTARLLILHKWRGSLVPNISDVKTQMTL